MKNRIIAVLLVIGTLVSVCNYSSAITADMEDIYTVTILADGETVDKVTVPESEKKELTAVCSPARDGAGYQWQICADVPSNLWVDIYAANEDTLDISYALMASLLDDSGSVYIRAKRTVDGAEYVSEPVCATVAFSAKYPQNSGNAGEKAPLMIQKASAKKMMLLGDPLPPPEYVTVTINYLDWQSKDPVYSPYTATVSYGAVFNQTVTSPTFLGYAPYTWDGANTFTPATSYELNYAADALTADTAINIYYRPIQVGYSVRYFFQNIANDLYTEKSELFTTSTAETGTIVDNETLEEGAGVTTGFTKLYHYPESVAADGSTVFECYYDRNYYFYKFNLNGGYGTDPIYARYGTPFTVPDPTRHGYVFEGWADITEDPTNTTVVPLPTTIGSENKSYKAIWETVDTTYSVVYWLENADDENGEEPGNGYGYWTSIQVDAQSNAIVSGNMHEVLPESFAEDPDHANEAYYSLFSHADGEKVVEGDGSTVINVYFNRKEYDLKFYYAMESEENGEPHYYVVGGSTYFFGQGQAKPGWVDKGSEVSLLDQYNKSGATAKNHRGEIAALPALNANGLSKGYVQGYDNSTVDDIPYKYHYLKFSAKYGSAIEAMWPLDILTPVTRISPGTNSGWTPRTAYASGWNGEYKVSYSWNGPKSGNNVNETIKAKFGTLTEMLLWEHDREVGGVPLGEPEDDTVSYLCFWENGVGTMSWSVPKRFQYKIWLPCMEGVEYSQEVWIPSAGNLGSIPNAEQIAGRRFYLHDSYATYDDSSISQQTIPAITGFENLSISSWRHDADIERDENNQLMYKEYYDYNIFYERLEFELRFENYGGNLISSTQVLYEADISDVAPTPDYPATLEPNAYYFDGWYTTPEGYEGSKFDFTDATMPAKPVTLYAKWKPRSHTVRFFATYADMLAYESMPDEDLVLDQRTVDHGSVVGLVDTPDNPFVQSYIFGGWFHIGMDNKTHMFAEYDTRISRDINVYANWGSKLARPYRIHYALYAKETGADWLAAIAAVVGETPKNQYSYTVTLGDQTRGYVYIAEDNSYHRLVAADTVGYAYEGSTRTFSAKAGDPYDQLYNYSEDENYNEGYFPTLSSHSILIAGEATGVEQPENNVFTFYYVKPSEAIKYTVNYLDMQTREPRAESKVAYTSKGVITERFRPVQNYIPDAFYKRLILSVHEVNGNWVGNDEENVINFYYTYNEDAAYYAVHYMLQKMNTTGLDYDIETGHYEEDESIIEAIADVGSTVPIQPLTFAGFTLAENAARTAVGGIPSATPTPYVDGAYSITVAYEGTDLYIYYTRNKYPVRVRYYKYNTNTPVNATADPVHTIPNMWYGDTASHTAAQEIYDAGGMPWVLVDTENITKTTVVRSVEEQNEIIFYYIEREYLIEYNVVGGIGGTLSRTQEQFNTVINGSIATPWEGYVFDGWFLDEECTQPARAKADLEDVGSETDNKIIPQIMYLHPLPGRNVFYARFKTDFCNLTIQRTNADDESNGDQVFVYEITDVEDPDKVYYVTVKTENGEGSETIHNLPASLYQVRQMNDWSWRYADTAKNVDLHVNKSIHFDTAPVKDKWLNGNSAAEINKKN